MRYSLKRIEAVEGVPNFLTPFACQQNSEFWDFACLNLYHPSPPQHQALFGKKGTDFDFQGGRYQDSKARLEQLTSEQKKLGKNINKKAPHAECVGSSVFEGCVCL